MTLVEIPTPAVSCFKKTLPSKLLTANSPINSCPTVGILPGVSERFSLIIGSDI